MLDLAQHILFVRQETSFLHTLIVAVVAELGSAVGRRTRARTPAPSCAEARVAGCSRKLGDQLARSALVVVREVKKQRHAPAAPRCVLTMPPERRQVITRSASRNISSTGEADIAQRPREPISLATDQRVQLARAAASAAPPPATRPALTCCRISLVVAPCR